jgi:multidrug efflux pump subunit AcrB
MMTAVSFILGMIPLVLAAGAGANARQALGVTILGGMTAATTIGLVLIPGLYVVVQRLAEWTTPIRQKADQFPRESGSRNEA